MKTLLVTGASGFLGFNICRMVRNDWRTFGVYFSHRVAIEGVSLVQCDVTRWRELKDLFRKIRPDAVIHAAAVAKANLCQQDPSRSRALNIDASVNIAGLCSDSAIPCAFISTDLVFDGLNPPYGEDAPVSPVSVYGEHKVHAEAAMLDRHPDTVICRTALMFGDDSSLSPSFLQPMIAAMKENRPQRLFVDEFRTPLNVVCAVRGILLALATVRGRIHLGGLERISRYDFGLMLQDVLGLGDAPILPAKREEVPMAAPRPPDVSLDSSRAFKLGFRPRPLRVELEDLLAPVIRV